MRTTTQKPRNAPLVGLFRGIALLSLIALAGCEPAGCEPSDSPTLVIGKGLSEYVPLEDGGRVLELIHGTQGGVHTDMAVQTTGLDISESGTAHLIGTLGGDVVAETRPFVDLRCNGAANAQQGWALRLVWEAEPEDLDGAWVSITVEIEDAAGALVSATEADVLIEDPSL